MSSFWQCFDIQMVIFRRVSLYPGMLGLSPNWVILARFALILKIHRFVTFRANLTQFGPNHDVSAIILHLELTLTVFRQQK